MSDYDYDDLLPVSLHTANDGVRYLMDRHNNWVATFELLLDDEVCEFIVEAINKA